MHTRYEFRVDEEFAHLLFNEDEGIRLGTSVRKIILADDDVRLPRVGELERSLHAERNRAFFYGWDIHYRYTRKDLQAAEAFVLWPTSTFEPCGEECGTVYDETTACPHCGGGATQVSDLRLDLRKAPRSKEIARTIANEIIVSQRLAEMLTDARLTGFELRRVRHKSRYEDDPHDLYEVPTGREILGKAKAAGSPHPTWSFWVWLNRPENRALSDQAQAEYVALKRHLKKRAGGKPGPVWYQIIVRNHVDIVPPTRTGVDPFDDDEKGEHRCPRGDTIGLNLLTELYISRGDFEKCNCDIAMTRQYIGVRRGLLRPEHRLIVSPKFWRVVQESGLKGFRFEVAYLK
jgi:hypothetical protein